MRTSIAAAALAAVICLSSAAAINGRTPVISAEHVYSFTDKWYLTEIYFGMSIPNSGGTVSEADWTKFVADEITPRFPSGFTVVPARGHYREDSGEIITEPTMVLMVVYPAKEKRASRKKIDEIRAAYQAKFRQQSVMRIDIPKSVRVYFGPN